MNREACNTITKYGGSKETNKRLMVPKLMRLWQVGVAA